jgi:hypothetical protein
MVLYLFVFITRECVMFQNVQDCIEIHDSAIGDLSRDLATIHQICATHLDDLRKLSETQVSRHTVYSAPVHLYPILACSSVLPWSEII